MGTDCDDEELVGRHLWEQVPGAIETSFYEQYHRALQTGESVSFEEYFEPLDVWFEVRAYPDEDGLSVYFTDVTDRKQHHQELARLQNLLEQTERIADVGGWEIEVETMEVFWTDHLFDLLGFAGDEEPPLDEALDVYLPEDRSVVRDAVDAAIDSGESFDVEVRYRRSGEDVRWLRVQGVPVVDDGDVVTVRGTAQDITGRKERERTLDELLAATRRFIEAGDEAELLGAVLEGIGDVFEHEYALIRRYDPDEGTLSPTEVSPGAPLSTSELPTYDADEGFVGEVFQSGEPAVVRNLGKVSDHDYGPFESAIVLPLGDYGTLALGAMESGAFDVEEAALVELLALAAASAFGRLDREAEMRTLERIVEHVDQKALLLDGDGQFAYATSALASYLGCDRERLAGKPLWDVTAPGDRDSCEEALETVLLGADGDGRTVELEVELELSDGDSRPAELELSPVEESNVTAAAAGVVTDISELAATRSSLATERERFQELFENLPDPVAEVEFLDEGPVVRYVNPAFTEVFGYDPGTAHGTTLNELIVPDAGRAETADLDGEAMRSEVTSAEVKREATDGPRNFLLRGIPYARDGGTHGFAVYTDITEQKERERYLKVLNRVLRHNLRNDMTVVMALAKRLARDVDDEELAGYARTLLDNAEDVATLSEKAKEIERVLGRRDGSGQTRPVDLASRVGAAVEAQIEAHPEADVSVDVPDGIGVVGDDGLQRACEELVENAIEHAESGSPRVEIEAREDPERDDWVELRVRDDGPGIPESEWRIVAGEEDISQLSHGSGLGLWLTRWIVESHGGEIHREDPEDTDGTTVVLRLRRTDPGSRAEPSGHGEFA
jgi:PAS domain S-box-containing protein